MSCRGKRPFFRVLKSFGTICSEALYSEAIKQASEYLGFLNLSPSSSEDDEDVRGRKKPPFFRMWISFGTLCSGNLCSEADHPRTDFEILRFLNLPLSLFQRTMKMSWQTEAPFFKVW